ncbi:hypothetical protein WJX72_007558 [[Myrmecia] bisecta]|uniref:Uncharacterized protein n=1 Tax=[Myrmecia] bisecta TaxID=41462 RepID=A0AAW1R861_9CHLO
MGRQGLAGIPWGADALRKNIELAEQVKTMILSNKLNFSCLKKPFPKEAEPVIIKSKRKRLSVRAIGKVVTHRRPAGQTCAT